MHFNIKMKQKSLEEKIYEEIKNQNCLPKKQEKFLKIFNKLIQKGILQQNRFSR